MSWKQAAGLIVIIFVLVLLQSVAAGPVFTLQDSLNESGDYDNAQFDGNELINGLYVSWFDMGLVAVFLLLGVALARVVRRELNKFRRQP